MIKFRLSSILFDFKSCELLTLMYGSIVSQIIKDFENVQEANIQLEKM
jgi:hypothetical protein